MPSPEGRLRGHHYECPKYHVPGHANDHSCEFDKCEMPTGANVHGNEYTVHVSGCDQSTAMLMKLDAGEIELLKEIHTRLKESKRACSPTLMVYNGDVCEYEPDLDEDWNPIPDSEKPTGNLDFGATLIPLEGFSDQ